MNRFFVACTIALLLTSGCATTGPESYVPPQHDLITFDFSEYTEEGFTFTPQDYDGPYKAVGMISMTIRPEAQKMDRGTEVAPDNENYDIQGDWMIKRVTTDRLVQATYEEAVAMGANGIINFDVTGRPRSVAPDLTLPEYTVSGFAVLLWRE